jgi:hypothetical protein
MQAPPATGAAACPPLGAAEERTLDCVTSIMLATERFAFCLGDAPAELPAELPPLPEPPADACSTREASQPTKGGCVVVSFSLITQR